MSVVRKTISVTKEQDVWVKSQVKAGNFTNDSEVHRALLTQALNNEKKRAFLKAEIQRGLDSGYCDQTAPEIIEELKAELRLKVKFNALPRF